MRCLRCHIEPFIVASHGTPRRWEKSPQEKHRRRAEGAFNFHTHIAPASVLLAAALAPEASRAALASALEGCLGLLRVDALEVAHNPPAKGARDGPEEMLGISFGLERHVVGLRSLLPSDQEDAAWLRDAAARFVAEEDAGALAHSVLRHDFAHILVALRAVLRELLLADPDAAKNAPFDRPAPAAVEGALKDALSPDVLCDIARHMACMVY